MSRTFSRQGGDRRGLKSSATSNENRLKPVVFPTHFSGFSRGAAQEFIPGRRSSNSSEFWGDSCFFPAKPLRFSTRPPGIGIPGHARWKPVETGCAPNPLQWCFMWSSFPFSGDFWGNSCSFPEPRGQNFQGTLSRPALTCTTETRPGFRKMLLSRRARSSTTQPHAGFQEFLRRLEIFLNC